MKNKDTEKWYDESYNHAGFKAQRQYPNEELLRFLGRNYSSVPFVEKHKLKVLEVGCGSCSNLWMIAKEGFDTYGIDISAESLQLGKKMLEKWNVNANISKASMTDLLFGSNEFDVVVDIFSSYCLNMYDFDIFLKEVSRVLKSTGKLFMYTPSVNSTAYTNHALAEKVDELTLNGIYRKDSPFYGNFYPFRFDSETRLKERLIANGFTVNYCETITRSYYNSKELFQHISIEAEKK